MRNAWADALRTRKKRMLFSMGARFSPAAPSFASLIPRARPWPEPGARRAVAGLGFLKQVVGGVASVLLEATVVAAGAITEVGLREVSSSVGYR